MMRVLMTHKDIITQRKSYISCGKSLRRMIFLSSYISQSFMHDAIAILVNTGKVIVIPKQSKLQYQPAFYRL